MVLKEDGRVEKGVRGPRIDQRGDGDGRLAGNEELNKSVNSASKSAIERNSRK